MASFKKNMGFKWGVIGPGQIARDFIHDMALVQDEDTKVTAVVSHRLEGAKRFAEDHGIHAWFDDMERLFSEAPPDIVYVATPHPMHHRYALACLERGIAVVCEKPLAMNREEAAALVNAARTHGTFLLEGMWIRYLPSVKQVLELVDAGAIGRISSVTANMSYRAPRDKGNRFYDPNLGGGSLLDLGIYPVYLSLLLLGNPSHILATAFLSPEGIDKGCAVLLAYGTDSYAIAESSIVKETDKTATLWGGQGRITIRAPWNEKTEGIELEKYGEETHFYPCEWEGRGFQFEIEETLHCIREGRVESPLHSHAASLALVGVLDEIRRQTGIIYPADP